VDAELQDRIDLSTGLFFQVLKGIEVPGVDDQGLFTDDVGPCPKGQTAMGVMEVIG
jgi:hypothetical protein